MKNEQKPLSKLIEDLTEQGLNVEQIRKEITTENLINRKLIFIDSDKMYSMTFPPSDSIQEEQEQEQNLKSEEDEAIVHYFSSLDAHEQIDELNTECGLDETCAADLDVVGYAYNKEAHPSCLIFEIVDKEKFLKAKKKFNFEHHDLIFDFDPKKILPNWQSEALMA